MTSHTPVRPPITPHGRMATLAWTLALSAAAACAPTVPAGTTAQAPAPAAKTDTVYGALRWTRASAEHRVLYLQVYRAADSALATRSAGHAAGTWGVILDADETILDNSLYELERLRAGLPYTNASWNAWVLRGAAPALPGTVAFTQRVRALGGRVVIVTNRDDSVCDATRENLRRDQVPFDQVICKAAGSPDDKNPRFRAVQRGVAPSTLPPVDVVMWVGDNIQDFPGGSQVLRSPSAADSLLSNFGASWFLLPNALYGSWQANPVP